MSKLDELIRELCPDGVEYKRFDEVCTLNARIGWQRLTKAEYMSKGDYLLITGTDFTETHEIDYSTCVYVTEERYKQDPKIQLKNGDILITKDGTLGKVAQVKGLEMPATLNGGVFVVRCKDGSLENRFILHYLLSNHFQSVVEQQKTGSTISHLTQTLFSRLMIPLPPLEVQREIVRILDNFTNLTAELAAKLTAEFTARQRQYEFYRDKLLTFDVLKEGTINFCQRTLGEMFDFRNGLSKGKEFFGKGTPFIRYTDVYNHRTLRKKDITALVECTEDEKERLKVSRGDVLFTRTSETAEDIGWSSVMLDDMDDCVFNGFTIKATPKTKELLPEYCAYCFSTSDFRQYVTKHCAFTTRASLTGNTIAQYRMTIPPLDIQSRIVNVLDNFEKICSDLNIGLPAEIEARQKQYEYYRDKLLTFKEVAAT